MDPLTQPRAPRRRDPEATRDAILKAARELVAERGSEGMTISEVAHRAGVNRGTVYQHFRNRDELATAVQAWFSNSLGPMLTGDGPVGERIDRLLEFFVEHPETARLWVREMLSNPDAGPKSNWIAFVDTLRTFTATDKAQPGIDPEMLARILLAAPLVWSLWANQGAGDVAAREVGRFAREIKRLLLFGVMRPEAWPEMVAEVAAAPPARDEPARDARARPHSRRRGS